MTFPKAPDSPVSRIDFGEKVFSPIVSGRWIFTHSTERVSGSKIHHEVLLEEGALAGIRAAARDGGLPLHDGPYSDRNDHLSGLAERLTYMSSGDDETFVRLIALVRKMFVFDSSLILPDSLVCAGSILDDGVRPVTVSGGGSAIRLAHDMEPYILGTGILRAGGALAFPALAIAENGRDDEAEPVMAVIDLVKEAPLRTFSLQGLHPPMNALEILSDAAAIGLTHAMLAENRSKSLASEILRFKLNGRTFPEERIDQEVRRIARSLFNCYSLWPGSRFLSQAMDRLVSEMESKFLAAAALSDHPPAMMDLFKSMSEYLANGLKDRAERYLEEEKALSSSRSN
ncbi:MAG: hypothetical protein U0R44_05615 [Candidatus Micrarchaeia archaeon]